MKVIMICNTDAALYKFRGPIINELKKTNNQVITIGSDTGYVNLLENIVDKHYCIKMYGNENILSVLRCLYLVYKIIIKEQPDVIHGFTHFGNILTGILCLLNFVKAKSKKTKYFLTITGLGRLFVSNTPNLSEKLKRFILLKIYSLISLKINALFVQNSNDADLLRKHVDENIIFVQPGSGVTISEESKEREFKGENDVITVGMYSRIVKEKGVFEFFYAVKTYKNITRKINIKFVFAGGESLSKPFDDEISRLAITCGVDYLGYIVNVDEQLANTDVVVLPSYYREGIPRSLLEALSHDCFIITTDMPGCNETVIDEWNGFLIKPKSTNQLVSKFLLLNNTLLNSTIGNSILFCKNKFDSELVVQDTINRYHN